MTITDPTDTAGATPPGAPAEKVSKVGDKVFGGLAKGAGILILVTLAAVAIFLIAEAWPTFTNDLSEISGPDTFLGYVGPLIFGTILAAVIALVVATPMAVAVALFISHYAPKRLAQTLGYFVDLLAAIPSVVFGIWGISVLAPILARSVYPWLEDNLGFIPLFAGPASTSGRTMLTAGIVLAVMILPIITAISREVFLQTPRLHEEASLALGATKWEMIRQSVLPYGRSGVISGAMLGLGRALGETMAVAIILSGSIDYFWDLISNQNSNTIAANIALSFPESSGLEVNRLIATGLVLFGITFLVNALARKIASAGFSGADG
ncbi:phosphate ABC transporter membrane protein 1 (PhoT family) [Ilumatobacter fluminis]|uniref:Phosphate transport system permease protein n=1 Tax=Ilumatobacter fluminis TaxID=467091 RepID=A0A4R7I3M0_9ACTN|nr:phosphate ABC transporter permease subunit PstC [Ilumatobacter fluminis]TDT17844.1 phosphate ABC transporter membrane protein 1 (PhoT family) [Ilumatobacter fluminis]